MAFRIYKVIHMACLPRSWFVYTTGHKTTQLTTHTNDFVNAESHATRSFGDHTHLQHQEKMTKEWHGPTLH